MRKTLKYTDRDIDEDMKLTHRDYLEILHHYQPGQRRNIKNAGYRSVKMRAQRILADKLCRCIEASNANMESRRIGYCSRAIFNQRGLRHHGFRCKTKRGTLRPKLTRDITKTSRRLRIHL
jgi:hypothetical protein